MKFVAKLAIALATLLSSAILCWGQPPSVSASFQARPASKPNLLPPRSVEGTWVSDTEPDDATAMPTGPSFNGLDPTPYASQSMTADGQGSGDGGGDACGADGCDACDNGWGFAGLGGCKFNNLWSEVHAHRRVFVSVDYLSMWAKGNPLPPLVTTSPIGTPQAEAGVLPVSATTSILFGNERVDLNQRNGGRINVGYWLIDGEFLGVEGQYFALQQQNTLFSATSIFSDGIQPGDQILARPFTNVDPNLPNPRQDASILAFPDFVLLQSQGPLDGTVNIKTASNIQSAGALLRRLIWIDFTTQHRLDLLLGYRFFRTDDSVTINDAWAFTPQSGTIGPLAFRSQDIFSAKNIFNGGEIGLKYQSYHGPLSIELIGKCAFGNNHEFMYINGSNTLTTTGGSTTTAGGLLTQPTNIGTYRRDVFAVLPEANANLRWDLTPNLRATAGYTFIYTNRVQRSGSGIDTTLNPTQFGGGTLVGDARPAFAFQNSPFWVHGVSAGIEYRW